MKFIVTGGSGFIGSHLCSSLLKLKHQVVCVDNFYTSDKKNINHLFDYKEFSFKKKDITKKFDIENDGIFNLACPASPSKYQIDPIYTSKTSYIGTLNMLELAKKYNAIFLQASTSEIYGDPLIHPQKENYFGNVNTFGPRACYDEGKRIAETLCYDFHKNYNLEIRVPRIFNTYGPNMAVDDGRVVSNLITRALKNQDITIFGDGKQTRSFCYVNDLINALIKLINCNTQNINYPINIGNPIEISILELWEKIKSLTNSKSKIKLIKLPTDDPKQRKPDIKQAKKILKWEPKTGLEEGLLKTINYFQKKLST